MTGSLSSMLLRTLLVGFVTIVWAYMAHATSASEKASDLELAVAVAPLLVIVTAALWRRKMIVWPLAGGAAVLFLLVANWGDLRHTPSLVYYFQHAGVNLALALLFGRSLTGSGEPLITRIARFAHHGMLSSAQIRYTRQVTVAWTLFFTATAVVSTFLFILAPITFWSIFANLLAAPLLGVMFAAEFLIRRRILPVQERVHFADIVRAYRQSVSQASKAMPER